MLDREGDEGVVNNAVSMQIAKPAESELIDIVQNLKSVALLLKGLYGQINQEREVITMASGQMAHAVKQFEQHLIQFESFEKACRQGVVERVRIELKQNIKESAQTIAQEVTELAYDSIHRGIDSLRQLGQELTEHRTKQKNAWRWLSVLFIAAALLGGSLGGLVVHRMSYPTKVINKQRAAGEVLMRAWNKLSQAEQDKIKKLGGSHAL